MIKKSNRTLGEIFYFFTDELADITFAESFRIILEALMDSINAIFKPTEDQMEAFVELFFGRLRYTSSICCRSQCGNP